MLRRIWEARDISAQRHNYFGGHCELCRPVEIDRLRRVARGGPEVGNKLLAPVLSPIRPWRGENHPTVSGHHHYRQNVPLVVRCLKMYISMSRSVKPRGRGDKNRISETLTSDDRMSEYKSDKWLFCSQEEVRQHLFQCYLD